MFEIVSGQVLFCVERGHVCMQTPPYGDVDVATIKELVKKGERIPIPEHVPKPYADLITQCWHAMPAARPLMADVVASVKKIATATGECAIECAVEMTWVCR